ncbi:MAG: phosphatase PAP2 family protein [Pseudoxanthomonas sp.]
MQHTPEHIRDRPLLAVGPIPLHGNRLGNWWGFGPRFNRQHLWLPLAMFALASFVLMILHADQWLADRVYAMQGHAWSLRWAHVTEDLIHETGRRLSRDAWIAMALATLASLFIPQMHPWRRPLLYLLLATLLAAGLVSLIKRYSNMDCPWDLLRYGGDKAYYGLFEHRPAILGRAACFPAGHASAGYSWIALYFFLLATRPALRWWGLGFALGLGLVFGIAQQLRGAHFLSHDVWTLTICWFTALILYRLILVRRPRSLSPTSSK